MSAPTIERPPTRVKRARHTLSDIYHERTHFQFIERSWRWALLSGIAITISIIALLVNGLNLGIDFEGGTQWEFTKSSPSSDAVRNAVKPLGLGDAKILIVGGNHVRVQSKVVNDKTTSEIQTALAKYANTDPKNVSISTVGPTWGDTVSNKALTALLVFFGLIALYLTFRFEWKMALAAILAVIHDILITVGVYAVTGFEVTPGTVVAFLTILGFSLYDTVVVFDKVKENTSTIGTERGDTYSRMVNRSMNQVLMRSLNTSFVALLPVASLLFVGSGIMGAVTLRDFALALFVGLLTGAYSSIFVATPILAKLKEREPRYRALRERSEAQLARDQAEAVAPPSPAKRQPARAGAATRAGAVGAGAAPSAAQPPPDGGVDVDDQITGDEVTDDGVADDGLNGADEPGTAPEPAAASGASRSTSSGARTGTGARTPGGSGGVAPRPRQQRRRKRR